MRHSFMQPLRNQKLLALLLVDPRQRSTRTLRDAPKDAATHYEEAQQLHGLRHLSNLRRKCFEDLVAEASGQDFHDVVLSGTRSSERAGGWPQLRDRILVIVESVVSAVCAARRGCAYRVLGWILGEVIGSNIEAEEGDLADNALFCIGEELSESLWRKSGGEFHVGAPVSPMDDKKAAGLYIRKDHMQVLDVDDFEFPKSDVQSPAWDLKPSANTLSSA
ncbi:hypothetical protein VTO73DRAFT_4493 [Trametes versicolor]